MKLKFYKKNSFLFMHIYIWRKYPAEFRVYIFYLNIRYMCQQKIFWAQVGLIPDDLFSRSQESPKWYQLLFSLNVNIILSSFFSIKKGVDAEAHDENSNTALHGCMHFWESPFNLRLAALICSCMLGVTLPFVQWFEPVRQ